MTVLKLLNSITNQRNKIDKLEKIERIKRERATGLTSYKFQDTKVNASPRSDILDRLIAVSEAEEEKNRAIEDFKTLLASASELLKDRAEDKGQAVLFDLYVLGLSMAEVRAIYSLRPSEVKPFIVSAIKDLEEKRGA